MFDKESEYYQQQFTDGMVNEDRTSFVITVDKELFDQDPYSQLYANITMNTLVTLSTYVQAYNGIPVDEQTVKVIFLTDEGERDHPVAFQDFRLVRIPVRPASAYNGLN